MSGTGTVTFADSLRRHCGASGLTQEELAERGGLSPKGISDLERGACRVVRRLPCWLGR